MNMDFSLIMRYLPVKYRLICKEWSRLVPYNAKKLIPLLGKTDTVDKLLEQVKHDRILYKVLSTLCYDTRLYMIECKG